MVTRTRHHLQGGDSRAALPGWGNPLLPSLTAGDMRALLARTPVRTTTRLVYALLLINADHEGCVFAHIQDIADAARLNYENTRFILRRLREAGAIVQEVHGSSRFPSIWRIVGAAELAA